jgi:hypothetical protein
MSDQSQFIETSLILVELRYICDCRNSLVNANHGKKSNNEKPIWNYPHRSKRLAKQWEEMRDLPNRNLRRLDPRTYISITYSIYIQYIRLFCFLSHLLSPSSPSTLCFVIRSIGGFANMPERKYKTNCIMCLFYILDSFSLQAYYLSSFMI